MRNATKAAAIAERFKIPEPNFLSATVLIRGTSPYVQHAFSQKAKNTIIETQEAGSQSRKGRARQPKDFKLVYQEAMHISRDGWHGIPAPAFRNAMISLITQGEGHDARTRID